MTRKSGRDCKSHLCLNYGEITKMARCGFRKLMKLLGCGVFICVPVNLFLLIYFPSNISRHPCPLVLSANDITSHNQTFIPERYINCSIILSGSNTSISRRWCHRQDAISEADYVKMASNCKSFLRHRRYNQYPVTQEELEFPIAFSILMHDNVEQMERMLRAIYRPHNVYCIHVDRKSPHSTHKAVQAITRCLDNVFLSSKSVSVHWAEFTVLQAELYCLHDLWKYKRWKYYINLAGSEYPLKTNLELVQILKSYNGANEIDGSPYHRPRDWTDYTWKKQYWRTNKQKKNPPHGFIISKGSTHIVASRQFIDFALHDRRSLDLLNWMTDIRCPDEHFFQTLNNNPHFGIPGAYTGNPDLRDGFYVRYKIWQTPEATCYGKWVNYICVLGAGDLHDAITSKHLFLNKLNLNMDPVAFQCLEHWYNDRVQKVDNPDFNIEFYRSRKIVRNHV